jgi:hypothetical protein
MGPPKANQDLSVCYGESGDISRPNDDVVIGQCDLIVERDADVRRYDKTPPSTRLYTYIDIFFYVIVEN